MVSPLVGETVSLKSGGPVMTVREVQFVDGVESATCEWLVKGKVKTKQFPAAMLVKATPPSPRPSFKPIIRH